MDRRDFLSTVAAVPFFKPFASIEFGLNPQTHEQLTGLIERLDHSDEYVRQEAAVEIALGEFGDTASQAIPVFLERVQSTAVTFHDRALAAWALPHIGAEGDQVVPILLGVLDEVSTQEEAQLRWCAVESIRRLTNEVGILVPLAQRCMRDSCWKCQMVGLFVANGLIDQNAALRPAFLAYAGPLMSAELDEIREEAQRIVFGSQKNE